MAEEKKMTSAETGSVYEEGALKIQKLTPLQVVFTVVGCGVGSGCLGTAYGARLAGFPVITFWLIVSGITTLFSMYYVAESALRTRRMMQLPGLAEIRGTDWKDSHFRCSYLELIQLSDRLF